MLDFAGRLKSSPLYRHLGLKDLLPMKTVDADLGCIARPRNMYCFDAGEKYFIITKIKRKKNAI